MDRYVCVHGHFYQPPRENAWLEAVELQESAYPHHDWNERITDECYAPNARSRILDEDGRIAEIVSNYARMSFNFGPTLLSWLKDQRPEAYRLILDSDKESAGRFSGHGSALAQAHGHIILPLANERDRNTQVLWGREDFRSRFGRDPEGMWLPEAAVNIATLESLAEHGIKFTVLAPRQAARFREIGHSQWTEVGEHTGIDPTRAYLQRLPSGRTIALFFYDGPVSQGVAFEGLLDSGERFAERLTGVLSDRPGAQIAHIATDGESYGHHHRHGDMALAAALRHIESGSAARLTNYAEFLERHPPTHEAEIVEDSSWSCVHGVERWKSNCGCNTGREGWHQAWRGPLRSAMDWLRDTAAPVFERSARGLLRDPWAARDAYIAVILDRSPDSIARFFGEHAARELPEPEQVGALKLLELQRHLMLMYTSCGWFFDEVSGIETVQVLQYAGRAIQLLQEAAGEDSEPEFLRRLEAAPSNLEETPTGRAVYEQFVKPAMVDLHKLASHYSISSLFEAYEPATRIYSYEVERLDAHPATAGRARVTVGRARFTSRVTRETRDLSYAALHLGDHVLSSGVRDYQGDQEYGSIVQRVRDCFASADFAALLRAIDEAFTGTPHSLRTLFKDERRRVLDMILEGTLAEAHRAYRQVYEHHAPLLRFLSGIDVPVPRPLQVAAEIVLSGSIRRALRPDLPDLGRARGLLAEAQDQRVDIDLPMVAYALQKLIEQLAARVARMPDSAALADLDAAVTLAVALPTEVMVDAAQDVVFDLLRGLGPDGAPLRDLADKLHLRVGA